MEEDEELLTQSRARAHLLKRLQGMAAKAGYALGWGFLDVLDRVDPKTVQRWLRLQREGKDAKLLDKAGLALADHFRVDRRAFGQAIAAGKDRTLAKPEGDPPKPPLVKGDVGAPASPPGVLAHPPERVSALAAPPQLATAGPRRTMTTPQPRSLARSAVMYGQRDIAVGVEEMKRRGYGRTG